LAAQAATETSGQRQQTETRSGDMLYRTLGRTKERVSVIGLGGYHIGKPQLSDADSIKIIRSAIDRGITFMDNCWDYNNGNSEIRMGKALREGDRQNVFLMTKIDSRTKQEATRQLDESLKRLQTDHIDLLQHHEVIRLEDPDRIFGEGGAQEAMLQARKAGALFHESANFSGYYRNRQLAGSRASDRSCSHVQADDHRRGRRSARSNAGRGSQRSI
jgi:aryl-alcohol dehydrogenase-like predicted oxidoreductase